MQKNGNFSASAVPTVGEVWQNLTAGLTTCLLLFLCNKNERGARCSGLGVVPWLSISGFPLDFLVAAAASLPCRGRRRRGKHSLPASRKFTKIKTRSFSNVSLCVYLCGSAISLKHTHTHTFFWCMHFLWETEKGLWTVHKEPRPHRLICQRFTKVRIGCF